jgi:subtilisin-like proprotein convertase family protein
MSLAILLASGVALAVSERFSNPQKIMIWDRGVDAPPQEADPYPSEINVSGFNEGSIRDVNLKLKGFKHACSADVDVLLVGPQGQKAVVMSAVGNCADIRPVNITLDDEATKCLPSNRPISSDTYRPTQGRHCDGSPVNMGDFPSPAPAGPYGTALSVFDGTDPNGTWELYVIDTINQDLGKFRDGWSLTIRARVTV